MASSIQSRPFYLFLSFLEGGAVMAVELIGAKMLAPYFGTSMPVWAAALGLTLGGLTLGYFTGGKLSLRFGKDPWALFTILATAGFMTCIMPFLGEWIMSHTVEWDLRLGAVISLLFFMVPPLILLGTVSPIIIELITSNTKDAGNSAGKVYAISTTGGILATFAYGFWVIPSFGIRIPSLLFGMILMVPSIYALWRSRSLPVYFWMVLVVFAAILNLAAGRGSTSLVHYSEGILGQIKVADFQEADETYRGLFVNGTLQTVTCLSDPATLYWPYTKLMDEFIGTMSSGGKALLLGMAGGTLVPMLQGRGFITDIVDIDPRMEQVANDHFGIKLERPLIADDARHFLNTCNRNYDLVIFDTFHGESVPAHLLTRESLQRLAKILGETGFLIINFYGFETGPAGQISHALFQTLRVEGWYVRVFATPGSHLSGNLEFVATRSIGTLTAWEQRMLEQYPNRGSSDHSFVFEEKAQLPVSSLLTDEFPQSLWYAEAARAWRDLYRENHSIYRKILE